MLLGLEVEFYFWFGKLYFTWNEFSFSINSSTKSYSLNT